MIFPLWLESQFNRLEVLYRDGQLPHGLLIHGPFGTGRRLLGLKLADLLLGSEFASGPTSLFDERRLDVEQLPMHPDFMALQPLEHDKKPGVYKKNISVEQVRELIDFVSLTSHRGGGKVVIITPAQLMSISAANCLLKTLEEPSPSTYLILIAESLAALPATVVSRCHKIRVAVPAAAQARDWLAHLEPGTDWNAALEISAGAPLAALEWQRIDFPAIAGALADDLHSLRQNSDTPGSVARRWAQYEAEPCLRWLYFTLCAEIRSQICANSLDSSEKSDIDSLQSQGEVLNIEPDFKALEQIGELRRLQSAGLNMELQLAGVLSRWHG